MGNTNTTNDNCGEGYLLQAKAVIDWKLNVTVDDFVWPVNPDVAISQVTQKEIIEILEWLRDAALNPECYWPNLVWIGKQLDKVSGLDTWIMIEEFSEVINFLTESKLYDKEDKLSHLDITELKDLKRKIQNAIGNIKDNNFENKKVLISLLSKVNRKIKNRKKAEISERNLRKAERYPEAA